MANYIVLLIDYEPRSIERFRDPLVGAGYTVEVATDGVSGIEAFHRLNPDMVLVEAMIPKKHGFEVCQELKRTPHGRRTPVLITTGVYKGRKYRTQALHIYGCDEYIEKPIAPEQLLEIVGRFLGPGSSGPSGSSKDSESSDSPEGHEGRQATSSAKPMPSAPRAVSHTTVQSRPVAVPRALLSDETEDEIMARLDAILPGDAAVPQSAGHASHAVMAAVDVVAEPVQDAPGFDPIPDVDPENDPFAQMRAELDAELGQFSAALALSPSAEATAEPFPSDQQSSPSVLESLPLSEIEAPAPVESPESSGSPDEKPGQVVSFDTKRSRKNKKGKAPKAAPSRSQQTAGIVVTPAALPPMPESKPATTAVASKSRPAAAQESTGAKRRGAAVWIWAGVGVLAVGATYLAISWKGSTADELPAATQIATHTRATASVPAREAAPEPAAPAAAAPLPEPALAPAPAPVAMVPPPPAQPRSEAPTTNLDANKKNATKPVKSPDIPAKKAPEAVAVAGAHVTPPASKPNAKSVDRQKPPSQTAPAQLDADESVAGVETLPSAPAPTPVETIAPGTLVAIDETDAWPASLKRNLPTYPMVARQLGLEGTVVMNVLVNERGTVDQVVLVSGITGGDLNESAMRAVRSWTYRPATKQGVPVKVWTSEQISFKR